MKIPFYSLDFQHQQLGDSLSFAFAEAVKEGQFSGGKKILEFEKRFGDWIGKGSFIACSNGTDAMEMVFRTLGIKAGDEVIFPTHSCQATIEPALLMGIKPKFCNVNPEDGLLLRGELEKLISSETKAVVGVHLYGNRLNSAAFYALCKTKGVLYIEDCAHVGGLQGPDGFQVGGDCDASVFSFYPTKNLGALGEAGGMWFRDNETAGYARMMRDHGRSSRDTHSFPGRNARMDTVQATFLLLKMDFVHEWNEMRRKIAKLYAQNLPSNSKLLTHSEGNCHLIVVEVESKMLLVNFLNEKGITTSVHYPYTLPGIAGIDDSNVLPDPSHLLSLPCYPGMTEEQVLFVCQNITSFFQEREGI